MSKFTGPKMEWYEKVDPTENKVLVSDVSIHLLSEGKILVIKESALLKPTEAKFK